MNALLKKELLQLKPLTKNYIFSILIFSVIGVFTKNIMFVNMSTIILPISIVLSSFAFDNQSKWESFALTMPVKRSDLVRVKYGLYFIILLGLGLFANILNYTLVYPRADFELMEIFLAYYSTFAAINIMAAIQIPIVFKVGVEKARNLMMVLFFIVSASIGGLVYLLANKLSSDYIEIFFRENGLLLIVVSLLIQLLVFLVSYRFSLKFVENKDF